jgi:hypothetical protein
MLNAPTRAEMSVQKTTNGNLRGRHHNSSTTKSKLSASMHRPTDEELDSRRLTSLQLLGALKPETLRGDLNDQTTLGFLGTFTAQSKNLRYLRRP